MVENEALVHIQTDYFIQHLFFFSQSIANITGSIPFNLKQKESLPFGKQNVIIVMVMGALGGIFWIKCSRFFILGCEYPLFFQCSRRCFATSNKYKFIRLSKLIQHTFRYISSSSSSSSSFDFYFCFMACLE
mmetsp:Transcript_6484/g.8421  ORF Transcript_6484/g.8421 Transcript_6484/m.8421 type:complete len:132 (-) Transcript_6484:325-720(-)